MKPILLYIILLITFFAAAQTPTPKLPNPSAKTKLVKAIQQRFIKIDSLRHTGDSEKMEEESKKLTRFLALHGDELFKWESTQDFDFLYIAKSTDNKLCLISWDTRMGGTMIDFATLAFYKTTDGTIKYTLLKGNKEDVGIGENTLMHFDTVYTITTAKGNIYVAHGFGQGSTALPWQELRAFSIDSTKLRMPLVFPKKKDRLFVQFDTHQFGEDEYVPTIKIRNKGETILLPMPTENEGFSGKYQTLTFSGMSYKSK